MSLASGALGGGSSTVDGYVIFGSCVTRDVFRVVRQDQAIELYIARTSIISATSPPLARQVEIGLESTWQRRQLHNDLYKDQIPRLGQPHRNLIIDLVDERFAVVEVDGTFVTRSGELVRSGALDHMDVARQLPFTGRESRRLFRERAARFRDLIHPTTTVILHEALWSEEYIAAGERHRFAERMELIRRFNDYLDFGHSVLRRLLDPRVVKSDPALRLSTDEHLWGLAPCHYVDQYYWDVWAKIQAAARSGQPDGTPQPWPQAALISDGSRLKFVPVDLGGPAEEHVSGWKSYSNSVTVQPAEGGLRCSIQVGSERAGYGGVRFAVKPFKALRLGLEFDDPASIAAVYVDAQDSQGRAVRWLWNMTQSPFRAAPPGPYLLVPGQPSGYFVCSEHRDASAVSEVQVFVLAARGVRAGFALRKVELGQ